MPIRFRCESCESRIKVPDGSKGRRVRCPRCGHLQRVPDESIEPAAEETASPVSEPATHDDPAFDLADTPPTAPPATAETEPPSSPAPPPTVESGSETVEAPATVEPAPTDRRASALSAEGQAADAPPEADDGPEASQPNEDETLQVEDGPSETTVDASGDTSLFDQAQAETAETPERIAEAPPPLEEGEAITARDVVGRSGSLGGHPPDAPEPPAELVAGAAPRPRARPTPPPAIPLAGRPRSASEAQASAPTSGEAPAPPDAEAPEDQPPPQPVRLAPRHPSMPPPASGPNRPPASPPLPGSGVLALLSNLLRVVAMLLVVAGVVHLVQVLGGGTRIAVLFNAAVVWLAAASVTWAVGEIAAAVSRRG